MNIVIISQNYPPDLGAAAFRMQALAHALQCKGHQVCVVAGMPNRYKDYSQSQSVPEHEMAEGLEVFRVRVRTVGNTKVQRIRGFLEFYFGAIAIAKKLKARQFDIVVTTTPQLLQARVGEVMARKLKAKLLLDIRDLWPETPIALGELSENSPMAFGLAFLERAAVRKADHIVTTSPGYVEHIRSKARKSTGITVSLNGIDDEFLVPRKQGRKSGRIQVLYAGNVGLCQNLITFVEAASLLCSEDFEFKIIGSGTQLDCVKKKVDELKLSNVTISPPVSRQTLLQEYENADILYLQLFSSDYFRRVIPSKIFEYLALPKPIVYGLDGEAASILSRFPSTHQVHPDDPANLANTLREVAEKVKQGSLPDREPSKLMEYSRERQTERFVAAIESLMGEQSR